MSDEDWDVTILICSSVSTNSGPDGKMKDGRGDWVNQLLVAQEYWHQYIARGKVGWQVLQGLLYLKTRKNITVNSGRTLIY